ncbi:MAG: D-tyrosyl-tRNA(Tyr) deacylase [Gammaproteobacteria bacterium]|nr:MAG: D-tyrosyl-tRNA(Tyr) deacylase [Gammaproteobacteria bacterium]
MIALIQRVTHAEVVVDGTTTGKIEKGILALIGVQKSDSSASAKRLCERICGYRIFPDSEDKMNLSLKDINGGLLLVPQFTLAANTKKGTRASFASAAPPDMGNQLFNEFCDHCRGTMGNIQTGIFGADMKVSLLNDGPVTFWLES